MTTTPTDRIFNVKVTVLDLIEAESPEDAIAQARRRLEVAHFEIATDPSNPPDAIESEPLPVGTVIYRRGFRVKVAAA